MRIMRMGLGFSPVQMLAGGAALVVLDRAVKHQRTCSACAGKDFVAIMVNVPHVMTTPLGADQAPE
jgi:hypothetical protein